MWVVAATGLVAAGPAVASTSSPATPGPIFQHSVFSQPVTGIGVAADSSQLVASLVQQYHEAYGSVGVNRMPIFTVPANQARVPVGVRSGCHSFVGDTGWVPIPPGAYNSGPGDGDLIVEQPSTGGVWELWQATRSLSGRWSACWGGSLDGRQSSGVFPYPFGLSASGISYGATTITEADVASGRIDHAIAMQMVACNGFVTPADRGDCPSGGGGTSEGTWFRMPQSVPMPAGLTPFAQMVFRALQQYGAVVVDRAGAVMIEAESSRDWRFQGRSGADPITAAFAGAPQYRVLSGIPWAELQVLEPSGS